MLHMAAASIIIIVSSSSSSQVAAAAAATQGQRGVGFVQGTLHANCSDMVVLGTSWYYNWKPTEPCPPDLGSSYVPMICAP